MVVIDNLNICFIKSISDATYPNYPFYPQMDNLDNNDKLHLKRKILFPFSNHQ